MSLDPVFIVECVKVLAFGAGMIAGLLAGDF
jgi:hypothetical protein